MPSTAHAHTPKLQVVDPRGLAIRTVAYRRHEPDDEARAEIDRVALDTSGRPTAAWDPRLWHLAASEQPSPTTANVRSRYSLGGAVLRSDSTDAGWRVALANDAGLSVATWDARGASHRTTHDSLGRVVRRSVQRPGEAARCLARWIYAATEGAARNGAGRLACRYDTAGMSEHANYDIAGGIVELAQGFLIGLDEPDWPDDDKDREVLLEPTRFVTRWKLDPLGAELEQIDARGHVRRFAFGVDGALEQATLQVAGGATHILVHALAHDATGRIASQTAGNGVITRARFDESTGRLVELHATRSKGDVLQDLRYAYDAVGNVTMVEDLTVPTRFWRNQRSHGSCAYRYDSRYQLIEATGCENPSASQGPGVPDYDAIGDTSAMTPYVETYAYDAGSNLIELRHVGESSYTRRMLVATNANRALPWAAGSPEPDVASAFDAHGNLRTLQAGQPMRWTSEDQLASVTLVSRGGALADDDTETYSYDAAGERRRKHRIAHAGAVIHAHDVLYLPGLELRHDSASGERLDVITANAGRARVQVLSWTVGKPTALPDAQVRYQLDNHLGSATLELDADANTISQETYLPYGGTAWRAARTALEADYRTIRYSGKERDVTGLYYYGVRYYAPWLARWINPDPAGDIDGLNRYAFVRNNPSGNIDLEGMVAFGSLVRDLEYFRRQLADEKRIPDVRQHVLAKLAECPGASDLVDAAVIVKAAEVAVRSKDKKTAKNLLAQITTAEHDVDKELKANSNAVAHARERAQRELMREASQGPSRAPVDNRQSGDRQSLELVWVFAHEDLQRGLNLANKVDYRAMEDHMYRGMGVERETNKAAKAKLEGKVSAARALAKFTPTNEIARRLNENIHKNAREGPLLFRGMPTALVPESGEYQPGRFFAASSSPGVAARFGEGLIEMRGLALPMGEHYAGQSESEYLFPSTARYSVGRGKTTRLRLTRIA